MKILYLDFLYPKSHIRQNTTYISLMSEIADVYVLTPKGRYNSLPAKVNVIENNFLKVRQGRFMNRLSTLKVMFLSAITVQRLKPDYIFVTSYDTMMFALGVLLFPEKHKIFLLHHFNIDELNNKVKFWFFKKYMREVNHIVFEDFIKEYLVEKCELEEKSIHVLPHQLNRNSTEGYAKKYTCVGLSSSNDENIISEIIDIEKKEELLKRSGRKVILKSKYIEFDNGFLKVVKGYLDNDQYTKYINNSFCIYMPFPTTFRYRMSGTLVDALSNNKILIGNNIPIIQWYASKYSEVCKIVNSAEDFFKCILSLEMTVKDQQVKDFKRFQVDHSEEKIKAILKDIFCKEII